MNGFNALWEDAGAQRCRVIGLQFPDHDLRFIKPEVANCDFKWSGTKEN